MKKNIAYISNFKEWFDEFSFYVPMKVRFSETDMFGHVNNTSAFVYFEQARLELLAHLGFSTENLSSAESIPVVADLQCDFLKQIFFGETINVYVKVHQIGNSSIDIHYLVLNEKKEPCLTGRGRIVNINVHTGKPTSFTEEQKELLVKSKDNHETK